LAETVLITGGAGYIGSHTCKALVFANYLPVSLDNLVHGHEWSVKWGPFIKGDTSDPHVLNRVFETYHPKAVLHFAAFAYVGESINDPGKYYRNNVAGALTLLEAMRHHGCLQIVFSSSCATYGIPGEVPISESHPQRPISPYGWSKFMVEQVLRDFEKAHGIRHVSLRYFNAAGADPEGELGEDHVPETHLIPLVIQAALGQTPYVEIYGTDYPTPDGTAVRDYIQVMDLAEAHLLALNYLSNGGNSIVLNLGTGRGYSVREIIKAVEDIARRPVSVRKTNRRSGDPPVLVAESYLAAKILGWQPRYSDLHTILDTAWRWHRLNR
jgi:UDP-arabinose 4-epimerase